MKPGPTFHAEKMDRRERRSEHRSGGSEKLELAGRKKCRGDEVQSGSLNVSCQNLSAGAALWWKGERSAVVYTDDEG